MELDNLKSQLNVAQLQLVALNATFAANQAQAEFQNQQNVSRVNSQIASLNAQIEKVSTATITPTA